VPGGGADTDVHDTGWDTHGDTDDVGAGLHLRQHTADHPTADHAAGPAAGPAHADAAGAGRSGASCGDRLPSCNGLRLQKGIAGKIVTVP
jgi:hypothetical protein